MHSKLRVAGAIVLMLGTIAPPGVSHAAGPEAVPQELWWEARAATPLGETPLELARDGARLVFESTWWPLYRDSHGTRIEGARNTMRVATAPGRWRAGMELLEDRRWFEGQGTSFTLGARQLPDRRGTFAAAFVDARAAAAAAVSLREDGPPGISAEARLRLIPGWEAEWRAAAVPERGTLAVSWKDEDVDARSSWSDRVLEWRLRGVASRAAIDLGLMSMDRLPERGAERDRAEPTLSWRGEHASGSIEVLGTRLTAEGWHGAGRQSTSITCNGARYAHAAGPVSQAGAALALRPLGSTLESRAWLGRWSGYAAAGLALWPFESATAVLGTRRIAQSEVELRHAGVTLERRVDRKAGVGGGVALWWVEPRASYRTWQATLLGVGR